jgi:hypothetical protein
METQYLESLVSNYINASAVSSFINRHLEDLLKPTKNLEYLLYDLCKKDEDEGINVFFNFYIDEDDFYLHDANYLTNFKKEKKGYFFINHKNTIEIYNCTIIAQNNENYLLKSELGKKCLPKNIVRLYTKCEHDFSQFITDKRYINGTCTRIKTVAKCLKCGKNIKF